MIRSSQDTRRWAFYTIGAQMTEEDTGAWHGPVSSTRALALARFVRCSPGSAIACRTDTGTVYGPDLDETMSPHTDCALCEAGVTDAHHEEAAACSYCERTDTDRDDWTTRCLAGTGCNTLDGGPFDPYGLS